MKSPNKTLFFQTMILKENQAVFHVDREIYVQCCKRFFSWGGGRDISPGETLGSIHIARNPATIISSCRPEPRGLEGAAEYCYFTTTTTKLKSLCFYIIHGHFLAFDLRRLHGNFSSSRSSDQGRIAIFGKCIQCTVISGCETILAGIKFSVRAQKVNNGLGAFSGSAFKNKSHSPPLYLFRRNQSSQLPSPIPSTSHKTPSLTFGYAPWVGNPRDTPALNCCLPLVAEDFQDARCI